MEIVLLPENALRIKGKQATMLINPTDVTSPHQIALYFDATQSKKTSPESVSIVGPGEYEIGGIKVSGIKSKEGTVYSVTIDGIEILMGALSVIEKSQSKLKQHMILLTRAMQEVDASFVNGLATSVVMLYGDKAREVLQKFAKEGVQETGKYQVTKDKLPLELQTILLT